MKPNQEQLLWMYKHMLISRFFEEAIETIYMEGKKPAFNMANGPIPGEMHLSNGQEPCAVGVCAHLTAEDIVTHTHRPHHVAIAKGVNLKAMTAEIFGKETGLSGGRGGHMHIFDSAVNFSCSGIIGQSLGPAVGAALSRVMQKKSGVAVAYLGDAAANQGVFHEALNMAAVWRLPVIFIIEDNAWGISVPKRSSTAIERNSDRAAAYGMPGEFIPGNDPVAIFDVVGEAIARARQGEGPTLIEIETSRLAGHFMGDAEAYRPAGEKDALQKLDPIPAMKQRLLEQDLLNDTTDAALIEEAHAIVDDAIQFARDSDYAAPETAMDKVFI
ncbi:thiamine pyrophosphate-dependent dehydrogenase E1 component subunit alpha [Amphritea sp. 1_MG-2023]|uniref:thiamine pyrophosphate-dependent dehydrogenase E1 component subunit alpha n=1 Tax=Amphritea sp. 1_MG-2023 TaxID=3062670 RepID=UPI0026E1559E|nr:thiamine pyrophosphate-dependent dehydrogenase E1 component subunit alpha [Amphritea sp. 1_MG-2023]MDO6563749.1 thiamine pyrophosphate-dependent dehydrogenase E1 component subunit alpha [Amphritea sp. 1_MG-2023]